MTHGFVTRSNTLLPLALIAAGAMATALGEAQAQEGNATFGDKANMVRAGAAHFFFNDDSGDLSGPNTPPGVQIDVEDTTVVSLQYSRLIGNRFGVDVMAGIPFEVSVNAAGTLDGAGEVMTTTVASGTLLGTYYLTDRGSAWRPYVSAGYNMTKFYDAEATPTLVGALSGDTDIEIEDSTGPGVFAGLNYSLNESITLSGIVGYQKAEAEATLVTETVVDMGGTMVPVGEMTRTIETDINPVLAFATVGFRF